MRTSSWQRAAAILFIVAGVASAGIGLFRFGGPVLMTLTAPWLWILWPIGFLALAGALVIFAFAIVRVVPARVALVLAAVGLAWNAAAREAIIPSLSFGPTSMAAVVLIAGFLVGAVILLGDKELAFGVRLALLVAAAAGAVWWSGLLGHDAFAAFGGILVSAVIVTHAAALIATGILLRRVPVDVSRPAA